MTVKSRVTRHYGGGRIYATGRFGSDVVLAGGPSKTQWQDSYTSPGPPYLDPNPFTQKNYKVSPLRVKTGITSPNSYYRYEWDMVPIAMKAAVSSAWKAPDWPSLVNQALAHSNPSKPQFDLPLFLFELKDLPRGIRDIGNLLRRPSGLARDPGGAYLSWQFGWKPLLNDLRNMLDLGESLERRLAALKEAQSRETISGKLSGFTDSRRSTGSKYLAAGRVYYEIQDHLQNESWFTSGYKLNPDILPSITDNRFAQIRWALGLNLDAASVWNMIPWSWLIDYFFSIGNFLEATRGYLPFQCYDMCIMSHTTVRSKGTITDWQQSRWVEPPIQHGGTGFFEAKERKVYADPRARILFRPFLTGHQMSILGALASSRSSAFTRGG